MEMETFGRRFQVLCLAKIIGTLLGLFSLRKFTFCLRLGVPGAFRVLVKAFNDNFSKVLMKHEQNPCDTAP